MLAISSPDNLWRVLASIYCIFIPSSMFYPLIRVLTPHPCLSPHPYRIRAIRIRIRVLSQPFLFPVMLD